MPDDPYTTGCTTRSQTLVLPNDSLATSPAAGSDTETSSADAQTVLPAIGAGASIIALAISSGARTTIGGALAWPRTPPKGPASVCCAVRGVAIPECTTTVG